MTREVIMILTLVFVGLLVSFGVLAWQRRIRRDANIAAPIGEIPAGAVTISSASGFYVATTREGQPLERLAIRHMGFRSRMDITVTTHGVALDLVGHPRLFLTPEQIACVALANAAIDRVVEPGGLVRLSWRAEILDGSLQIVDSYLRPQDSSASTLADQISSILLTAAASTDSTATPTGNDE